MAVATELVTRFGFEGSTQPLQDYNSGLATAVTRLGALGAAAAAAVGAAFAFTTSQANAKKEVISLSENLGISVQRLEELEQVSQSAGAAQGALTNTLDSLNGMLSDLSLGELNDGFKFLKGGVLDANGELINSEQLLFRIADQMRGLDRTEQIALANKLGIDQSMLSLLRMSSKEIEEQARQLRRFGEITQQDQETLKSYNKSVGDLSFGFERLKDRLAISLAPVLEDIADKFAEFIKSDDFQKMVQSFSRGIASVVEFLGRFSSEIGAVIALLVGSKGLQIAFNVLRGVIKGLRIGWIALFAVVQDFYNYLFTDKKTVIGDIADSMVRAWEAAKNLSAAWREMVGDFITDKLDMISEKFKSILETVKSIVQLSPANQLFGFFDDTPANASTRPSGQGLSSVTNNNEVNINVSGTNDLALANNIVNKVDAIVNSDKQTRPRSVS